ncbi:MAG: ATP-binding protein [Bacteroides thetaiotaomicron]|nr:ATP-binding protein [Bacteroides thetaiotaomicron]
MEDYNNKTKAELLEIIQNLEKKVEQLSSESASGRKERFRDRYSNRILDNLPDMLTVLDRDANIVELVSSPSTNHVEGTTADSITQSNIKDILPEDAYKNIRKNMEQVFRSGKSTIARHDLMMDGVPHHYEHWLSLLDKEYLLCMCRDVSQLWETEQTNAEQQNEIMRLNSLMEAIVNNVPVYLFVKDSGNDFRYLYWNKTFADYSGIPIEKAIGRNDFEIFKRTEDMEKFRLDDIRVLKEGKLDYFEEYMAASGEIRTITTMKRLVPSSNEHPYIIGISWDITEIKKTEKALDAARIKAEEADRLKSAFLANMSHEIRTPLNAIVGFSKLISSTNNENEKNQYAEIIERNSDMLLNLFNDILDLSSLEADSLKFNIQPVKILDICLQLEQQYGHKTQADVKLILDGGDTNTFVSADWNRTIQIVSNLLSNAVKFTSRGEIHFGFLNKENFVEFYVRDTGIGIPAERAATIFQRFGKVDDCVQGTGLGLTLCKMLVEKMGGHIRVCSKEDEGTTFYFTLPLANR